MVLYMLASAFCADFYYGFWHCLLLHGPLWSTHKEHHHIYRPTVTTGRFFDALDWFCEYHLDELTVIITMYLIPQYQVQTFLFGILTAESFGLSMEHHCG